MHPHTGKPPANAVFTAQAAELLGSILPSSARARLRRRKVREFYVQLPVGSITAYWQKKKVLGLVERQAAVHRGTPRGMQTVCYYNAAELKRLAACLRLQNASYHVSLSRDAPA